MRAGTIVGLSLWASILGVVGYFFFQMNERGREERELRAALGRLMSRERVARIYVRSITDGTEGRKRTQLQWLEERDGNRSKIREITIEGEPPQLPLTAAVQAAQVAGARAAGDGGALPRAVARRAGGVRSSALSARVDVRLRGAPWRSYARRNAVAIPSRSHGSSMQRRLACGSS